MAKGNRIIVTENPRGVFTEGFIAAGETPSPGTVLQIQDSAGIDGNGRMTFELANMDGDGTRPKGPLYVLLEDSLQGRTSTDAYAAGEACFLYTPAAGEELNMLVLNLAGTADDHPFGEMLVVDDTTGQLIVTPGGAEETEPFKLLEAITDPTADTLAHVVYTGY